MAHKWKPIEDLPDDFDKSADNELREFSDAWDVLKDNLDQEELRRFNDELKREWSIETGQIEGAYNLSRGTTETLIKRGIDEQWISHQDGDSAKIAAILHDHENVINGLFDFIKETREISTSYIKELHAALMRNQHTAVGVDQFGKKGEIPLLRGEYKKRPNNPKTPRGETHEYCPPEHTASEMDRLLEMHEEHVRLGVPPLAEAAWLHHRFVQIHPFQDGNGRVVRCLATLVLIKAGLFPLVIRRGEEREKYIDTLEAADNGDLLPLVNLLADLQKEFFANASRIAGKIRYETTIGSVIKSAAEKLQQRLQQEQDIQEIYENARITADNLANLAHEKLNHVCKHMQNEFDNQESSKVIFAKKFPGIADLQKDLAMKSGNKFGYYPNPFAYHELMFLSASDGALIFINFHGTGQEYCGIIACSVIFMKQKLTAHPADNVFLINYKEPEKEVKKRFEEWLEEAIVAAMQLWRDNL